MKRLTATLLATLCLLLVAPRATAADVTEWTIDDANLSLSLPSELAVATRDGIQSHPEVFQQFGLDADGLQQLMLSSNGYLNAIQPNAEHEYVVIVVEPSTGERFWNFNTVSDELLKQVADGVVTEVAKTGYEAAFEEIVKIGDLTYLVFTGTAAQGGDDYRQYYTTVNGRMTSITMHSYTGPITDVLAAEHRTVVESARFLSVVADPDPNADPSVLVGTVQSVVTWVMIIGGILVLGVIALIVVLVRRSGKRKAAAAAAASSPVGYPPATPGQPPVAGQPAAPAWPAAAPSDPVDPPAGDSGQKPSA